MVFFRSYVKGEGWRERKTGDGGQSNWERGSLAVSLPVPEDRLPDQRSQTYGWQDVTLWWNDVPVRPPSSVEEMQYLHGLKDI